jgi:hypothetical protein
MSQKLPGIIAGAILSFTLVSPGVAQSTFGSVTGAVKDPTGAVVPSADVEVINDGTGTTRKVTTSSAGVFNVPNLDNGAYRVRVSAAGFTTYERGGLNLAANQILNLDVQLKLGATTSVLEVQAPSPAISTETVDISNGISHESLEAMPLIGRHDAGTGGIYTYVALATSAGPASSGGVPSIQGIRIQTGTLPTMDGIAVMAYAQGAGPVQPSLEGIQELKIETSVAPAEFPTAGNYQVITRSGTNRYHGSAFWDYNGNALNARSFFASAVPWRVYHNFGASAGGPVKKNKIFFFADYEGARESATRTVTESVPLPAWRNGDFSSLGRTLTDPTTGTPFPGAMIPATRISPVSQKIQAYAYPLPNRGAPGTLASNWSVNVPGTTGMTVFNSFDGRADFNLTDRDSVFGRASWRRIPLLVPGNYPIYRVQTRWGQSEVLSWNHIFSPTKVNEFRFGTTYHRNFYTANVVGSDLLQQFGILGIPTTGVKTGPAFSLSGGVTAWDPDAGSLNFQDNPETTLEWIDNLSWTGGRHLMKFGFDAIRDRLNGNNINAIVYGRYSFSGIYTGNGYADFLLGIPQTTDLALPNPNRSLRGTTWGFYAQDQFRVNSSLTLNYGMRWELEQPSTDNHGALYTFDLASGGLVVPSNGIGLISPFYPKNIPIKTAVQAGYAADTLVKTNWHNFEPRVGFAYKLFGSDKTVIRGGYGIYSNLIYTALARSQLSGGPFAGSVTYRNSITNGVPLFSFPSPVLSSTDQAVQNVSGVNPNLKSPYTEQWNVTVERQMSSVGLRASYVGSRSVNLVYRRNLNEPVPSTTPFSTKLYPYQLYSQIIYADSGGTDSYNALELAATKKYGANLTLNSGYTWGKDLTDTQDNGGGGTTFGGQVLQDQFNRTIEKANSGLSVSQRFFGYAVYALPVGRGQHFLSHAPRLVQAALGGWRTNWTAVMQSGLYFTPSFSAFGPSNTGVIGGNPNRIRDGNLSSGTLSHWFDTAAFAIPGCPSTNPVCSNPANVGRFGNSGFNILRGPHLRNLDFGLEKDFSIREHVRLQFNMIMANALNHPNFSAPNSNISSTTVGIISGTTSPLLSEPAPRNIDFSLRLTF